jgi:hypothetical protein
LAASAKNAVIPVLAKKIGLNTAAATARTAFQHAQVAEGAIIASTTAAGAWIGSAAGAVGGSLAAFMGPVGSYIGAGLGATGGAGAGGLIVSLSGLGAQTAALGVDAASAASVAAAAGSSLAVLQAAATGAAASAAAAATAASTAATAAAAAAAAAQTAATATASATAALIGIQGVVNAAVASQAAIVTGCLGAAAGGALLAGGAGAAMGIEYVTSKRKQKAARKNEARRAAAAAAAAATGGGNANDHIPDEDPVDNMDGPVTYLGFDKTDGTIHVTEPEIAGYIVEKALRQDATGKIYCAGQISATVEDAVHGAHKGVTPSQAIGSAADAVEKTQEDNAAIFKKEVTADAVESAQDTVEQEKTGGPSKRTLRRREQMRRAKERRRAAAAAAATIGGGSNNTSTTLLFRATFLRASLILAGVSPVVADLVSQRIAPSSTGGRRARRFTRRA